MTTDAVPEQTDRRSNHPTKSHEVGFSQQDSCSEHLSHSNRVKPDNLSDNLLWPEKGRFPKQLGALAVTTNHCRNLWPPSSQSRRNHLLLPNRPVRYERPRESAAVFRNTEVSQTIMLRWQEKSDNPEAGPVDQEQ